MTEQQKRKQHIRAFMQAHYTDERLAQLLAHAQDGKLAYCSCCCLIGIPTANHALRGECDYRNYLGHDSPHNSLSGDASSAYANIALGEDSIRRRILIPMIRAEMKRRAALAAPTEDSRPAQRVAEPVL